MKKILFVCCLVYTISCNAKGYYYSDGVADILSERSGYIKSSMSYDEDEQLVTTRLVGDWESIGVGADIHEFAKIAVDGFLNHMRGHKSVQGWVRDSYGITRKIRVERNLIEFRIYEGHDVIYVYEYIDNYPATKSTPKKKAKRNNRRRK